MEQGPSCDADNCSSGQIVYNLKILYCVQKSLRVARILSQMNPVHKLISWFFKSRSSADISSVHRKVSHVVSSFRISDQKLCMYLSLPHFL